MKKFFGVLILTAAFMITSCGVNDAKQNASVEFCIPVENILMLRNETGTLNNQDSKNVLKLLVQLKGSNGYYAAKIKTVDGYSGTEPSFTFDALETNQTYDIFVDVFNETKSDDAASSRTMLWCSAEEKNISIAAGVTTPVLVEPDNIDRNDLSLFDIKIDYKDGGSQKFKIIKINSMYLDGPNACEPKFYIAYCPDDNKYYYSSTLPASDSDWSSHYENQSHTFWKEITDLSYLLKDGTHFKGFDFIQNEKQLAFENGIQSVKTYMTESGVFNYPLTISKVIGSTTLSFSTWLPQLRFYSIEFNPDEQTNQEQGQSQQEEQEQNDPHGNTSSETTITEEIHGSLLESSDSEAGQTTETRELVFTRRGNSEDMCPRYIYEASLANILQGKTLSTGDTIVFKMQVVCPENKPLTFDLFYYELQKSDWNQIEDDTELYNNNECIGVDTQSIPADDGYTFVMPLNFINDPDDYDTVLFFFDGQQGETDTTKSLYVRNLDYYIFPAASKTFVFSLGKNYSGNNPYRYEFERPLIDTAANTAFEFRGGETVSITIGGNVVSYTRQNGEHVKAVYNSNGQYFTGEIFDNAEYDSSINQNWRSFHPLSNTAEGTAGNKTALLIRNGVFSGNGKYMFVDIQEPYFDKEDTVGVETLPAHNYKFQCVSVCEDPSVLLAIENFSISMEAENP